MGFLILMVRYSFDHEQTNFVRIIFIGHFVKLTQTFPADDQAMGTNKLNFYQLQKISRKGIENEPEVIPTAFPFQ